MDPSWRTDLDCLFRPTSVAVLGATDNNHYSVSLLTNLRGRGFPSDRIYPVNPNRSQVCGFPCFPSLESLPAPAEAAVLLLHRGRVVQALEECGRHGVKAAVVITTGFRESDEVGAGLQDELRAAALRHGLRLCGPNCTGIADVPAGVALSAAALDPSLEAGAVSCVFQSGGLLNAFLRLAAYRHIGLRRIVSSGNEAVLTIEDYLDYLCRDEVTRVILCYVEALKDHQRFYEVLRRAREARKPIIAMKGGRSPGGQRAALSHTGSVAGSAKAWDAMARQMGLVIVEDLDAMVEAAELFSRLGPRLCDLKAGFVTISGGDTVIMSDACHRAGLVLPELTAQTVRGLRQYVDKVNVLGNPLDLESRFLRMGDPDFFSCVDIFMRDPGFSMVGCRLNLPASPTEVARETCQRLVARAREVGKVMCFFSRATEPWEEEWHRFFASIGAPFLQSFAKGCRAMGDYVWYWSMGAPPPRYTRARGAPPGLLQQPAGVPAPYTEVVALLESYGIPLARGRVVTSAKQASMAGRSIGFPVALKLLSPEVPHKSDAGLVLTGVSSAAQAASGYRTLLGRLANACPGARAEGVLVQEQVAGVAEVIAGIAFDPEMGPMVLLGMGGIFAEVLRDAVLRVAPLTPAEARCMLKELAGRDLLTGTRGRPQGDLDALTQLLLRLSDMALDLRGLPMELDLNPVVVGPRGSGVKAVDALLVRL